MYDYKSPRAAVMTYATLVNTQTDIQTQRYTDRQTDRQVLTG